MQHRTCEKASARSQAEADSSVLLGYGIEASCLVDEVHVDAAQDVRKSIGLYRIKERVQSPPSFFEREVGRGDELIIFNRDMLFS